MRKEIEHEVKIGGYVSVSEFFRAVMRDRKMRLLAQDVEESKREFSRGKAKVLRSLRDLR